MAERKSIDEQVENRHRRAALAAAVCWASRMSFRASGAATPRRVRDSHVYRLSIRSSRFHKILANPNDRNRDCPTVRVLPVCLAFSAVPVLSVVACPLFLRRLRFFAASLLHLGHKPCFGHDMWFAENSWIFWGTIQAAERILTLYEQRPALVAKWNAERRMPSAE